ncbi:MAG: porin family protein [Fibrobacterota bacterium]
MKRFLIVPALLLLLSTGASANNAILGGFHLVMSDINGTGDYDALAKDYTMRVGYGFGGYFSWDMKDRLSLLTGLWYETRGAEQSDSRQIPNYHNLGVTATQTNAITVALSYLQIPALFSYNVMTDMNLFAGPELGFLLTSRSIGETSLRVNNTTDKTTVDSDSKDLMSGVDFTLSMGGTYLIMNQVLVMAALDIGLIDIVKDPAAGTEGAQRNFALKLGVGYRFDLRP